jgi:hypothetical protein
MQVSTNKMVNSISFEQQKEIIRKEINQHKVNIDYACFKHTDEDKSLLFKLKTEWRDALKKKGIPKRQFKHTIVINNRD